MYGYGTLRRASLAQGRLKTQVVPFQFVLFGTAHEGVRRSINLCCNLVPCRNRGRVDGGHRSANRLRLPVTMKHAPVIPKPLPLPLLLVQLLVLFYGRGDGSPLPGADPVLPYLTATPSEAASFPRGRLQKAAMGLQSYSPLL